MQTSENLPSLAFGLSVGQERGYEGWKEVPLVNRSMKQKHEVTREKFLAASCFVLVPINQIMSEFASIVSVAAIYNASNQDFKINLIQSTV